MSITEKVNLTTGTGWGSGPCVGNTGGNSMVPPFCLQDGPNGVRFTDFVTSFPSALATGSTFNKGLAFLRGKAMALEHKKKGVDVVLGPTLGPIGLKAQGGRNFESFGADPYIQGIMGSNTIEAIQKEGLVACARQLIGNEQETFRQVNEWDNGLRASISSNIGDRAMHEVYLWPFADAVHAGVGSVMCSYNRVNNTYACENSALINGLLKDELGFQGFVISDWGAQHSGVYSCLAGLDMSMPGEVFDSWLSGKSYWGPLLTRAVYNQTIPQARLNDMAVRILAPFLHIRNDLDSIEPPNFSSWTYHTYGQEYPYQHYGPIIQVNRHVEARSSFTEETALNVAREAIVLLKNSGGNLPISATDGVRRLFISGVAAGADPKGFNCKDQRCVDGVLTSGWGSSAVNNPYVITPYEAVARRAIKQGMVVDFCSDSYVFETVDEMADYADLAVVFVSADSGEGYIQVDGNYGDRKNLSLWHNGDELIEHVADRCRKTVVVVNSVGPVNMERWIDHDNVVAVLYTAPLGQFVGQALAEVLFGDVNPSGHLPFTIAKRDEHYVKIVDKLPEKDSSPQDNFDHDIYLDYKFFDKHNLKPRFEFGFGLSYTSFDCSNLKIIEMQAPTEYLPEPKDYLPIYKMCEDDTCDPEDALFPHEEFDPVPGFIYPYLFNDKIISTDEFEYPKGYTPDQFNEPHSAGGGLGGNPALWDLLYTVEATIKNDGSCKGAFVAQLYIEFPCTVMSSPPRQLRGFDKIKLGSGEAGKAAFNILRRDLSVWDTPSQQWIIQRGVYKVCIGSSSRKFELCGEIEIEDDT